MKVSIVYWSGTGNTKAMAEEVLAGAKAAGADATLFEASSFDASSAASYDALAFGCPAMGAEELEDAEFLPVFEACEGALRGKKIALFGSYGWGDGEWMRSWEERCASLGVTFAADSVICQEAPDDEACEACRALGAALAS